MIRFLFFSTLVSLLCLGCGEEHGHHGHNHGGGESVEEEACEHMSEDSSSQTIAGATEGEATNTEAADWLHLRNEVTLTADGEEFMGYVTLEIGTAGSHQLFANHPVEVTIGGIAASSTSPVDECTEVEAVYVYELPVGEYVLFARADQEKVALVLEFPGGHDDHGDH